MNLKKFSLSLFLLASFFSCGKKLPPPSPDIFPAKIMSGYYIPNSQIRVDFNEQLNSDFDSVQCVINGNLYPAKGYVKGSSLFIDYDYDSAATMLHLFGVKDEKKNKKNYLSVAINGKIQRDTMPPEIIKRVLSDSILLLEFSEDIASCSLELLPEYVKYTYEISKNRLIAKFTDTLGYYPLQMFVFKAEDMRKNRILFPVEYRFANMEDTSSCVSLRIDSLENFSTISLYDADSMLIYKKNSGFSSFVLFENLKQGRYDVRGESFFLDTLILK